MSKLARAPRLNQRRIFTQGIAAVRETYANMNPKLVFTLKITLTDTQPVIWRRLVVPADITLLGLHHVIQAAMGWSNAHLHYFADKHGKFYTPTRPAGAVSDGSRTQLRTIFRTTGDWVRYVYDCGVAWEHTVELEVIGDARQRSRRAECVGGQRRCPPEDCGGPGSFAQLLEALAVKKRPTRSRLGINGRSQSFFQGWLEGPFKPEAFNRSRVNSTLRCLRV